MRAGDHVDALLGPRGPGRALGDPHEPPREADLGLVGGHDPAGAVPVVVEDLHPRTDRPEALHQGVGAGAHHLVDSEVGRGVAHDLAGRGGQAHLLGQLLALEGEQRGARGLVGVRRQHPLGLGPRASPVVGHVHREHAQQLAVAPVQRRAQRVHGVPRVGTLDGRGVGHPAPDLHLGRERLVGDEEERAPVLGQLELGEEGGEGGPRAQQRGPHRLLAGDRDGLHLVAAHQPDRGDLEAHDLGHALGDEGQDVGTGRRGVGARPGSLGHSPSSVHA